MKIILRTGSNTILFTKYPGPEHSGGHDNPEPGGTVESSVGSHRITPLG